LTKGRIIHPVDAATLIILDRSDTTPKVLLGRRHAGHVFMPGKFVFPGGRVESDDKMMPFAAALDPNVEKHLLCQIDRDAAPEPHALALASIRETFEETGLLLGAARADVPPAPEGAWMKFREAGFYPDLSVLHFITRAITPPGPPRRFDARFFSADIRDVAHRIENVIHADAELVELTSVSIAGARDLDLPMITHIVLEELEARIAAGFSTSLPVPFYQMRNGLFGRGLLAS
jgi:8-oxo-dGTP pyrophosphatase MutT (NUDIX family)